MRPKLAVHALLLIAALAAHAAQAAPAAPTPPETAASCAPPGRMRLPPPPVIDHAFERAGVTPHIRRMAFDQMDKDLLFALVQQEAPARLRARYSWLSDAQIARLKAAVCRASAVFAS